MTISMTYEVRDVDLLEALEEQGHSPHEAREILDVVAMVALRSTPTPVSAREE